MASHIGGGRKLGDPVLLLNGLNMPGSTDDVTYGTTNLRVRAREMPYTNESGYVIRSLGTLEPSTEKWLYAGMGFVAGAFLCAVFKR